MPVRTCDTTDHPHCSYDKGSRISDLSGTQQTQEEAIVNCAVDCAKRNLVHWMHYVVGKNNSKFTGISTIVLHRKKSGDSGFLLAVHCSLEMRYSSEETLSVSLARSILRKINPPDQRWQVASKQIFRAKTTEPRTHKPVAKTTG
jgi:hypothetical protein